jgi:hypothetical protein
MNRDASVEEIAELLYNERHWMSLDNARGYGLSWIGNYEFEMSRYVEIYHLNSIHIEEMIGYELSPEQWSRVGYLYRKKTRDEQFMPSLMDQWKGLISGPMRIDAMIIIYLRAKEFGVLPLRQLLFEEFCVNGYNKRGIIDLIGISEAHEIEDEITSTARRKLEGWSEI